MPNKANKGINKGGKFGARVVKIGLVMLAMVFCFFLIYNIHVDYPYKFINPETATLVNASSYPFPLHNDEWAHLAMGLAIAKEHKINFNPYLAQYTQDREIGFHFILAGLFSIPGIDPISNYQYLAPVFLAINALLLFFLVFKLTKNYWAGLFSMLFFAGIKSNTNLIGNWFFIPLTFTLFIIFTYFYLFIKAFDCDKGNKSWLFFITAFLIFIISAIIYPFAAVLIAVISIIYTLTKANTGFVKKNWKCLLFLGALGVIIILIFIKLYFWNGTIESTFSRFIGELVFKKGWTVLEHTYSLLSFYGVVSLIFSCIGAAYVILKKKNALFIIWPAALLFNTLLFTIFKFSLLIPYQRNFFYLLVSLAPLSAIGLYCMIERIFNYSKKHVFKKKAYNTAVCAIVAIIFLCIIFHNYYKIEPETFSLQKIITQPEYDALIWLKETHAPANVSDNLSISKILAKPFIGITVYPISQNRVVGLIPSSVEGGAYGKLYDFFNGDCKAKQRITTDEKVDFVLASENLNCAFLGRIYTKDGTTIYRVI